jgi:hypothetical protein
VQQFFVVARVVALKARHVAPKVIRRHVVAAWNDGGEKSAAERRISDESDSEFVRQRQNVVLHLAGPKRIFSLQRRHRVHRVGAADRGRPGLGDAEMPDLALLLELRHGADGVLDRHRVVDPVNVIEIDVVGAEALQTAFAGLHDIVGQCSYLLV